MDYIDLTGRRFGRLVVLSESEPQIKITPERKYKKRRWLCQCDCGNQCIVSMSNLRGGHTKSCGCLSNENRILHIQEMTTHNEYKTRLYGIWNGIKQRVSNPNRERFNRYGGRGISICEEWSNSYESFRDWALSNGYSDELTIDRIDNNGDYCPDNCRWVSKTEQANNRSTNHMLTYQNETHTVAEWSRIVGIKGSTIIQRLGSGWSIDDALTVDPATNHIRRA